MGSAAVQYFHQIGIEPPVKMILARLGYRQNITRMTEGQEEEIRGIISEGAAIMRPEACFIRLAIREIPENRVILENGIEFKSSNLKKMLSGSSEAVIMASTVGSLIVEKRDEAVRQEQGARALVLDAAASETADAILDWLVQYINTTILRQGKRLTRNRFSPGYGDLNLENQAGIFDLLDLGKLGLTLTPSFQLLPEKSVTAIAGIDLF